MVLVAGCQRLDCALLLSQCARVPARCAYTAPPSARPSTPAGKEMQLLRAKALECVSLVGLAVGKERFG